MQHKHIAKRLWAEGAGLALDAEALKRFDNVIDLSIGDTDFITDARIIDAAFQDARAGYTKYGDPHGDPELIDAVRGYYLAEYGMQVAADEVFVTASSCMGMELALLSILNPGDEVLVFSPYFTPYKAQIELAGGVFAEVPTYEADGYAIREDAIRARLTDRTRAVIFNNPVNPTGVAYGMDTLELIARIAKERDLIVLADEIYTHYMFEGDRFTPLMTLPGMRERTVTLNSFSKNFMMTGWRIGYVVAAKHFTHAMQSVNNNMVYCSPSVSQRAALHALKLRDEIGSVYIDEYRRRVYYASDRVNALPYLSVLKPKGTFYLFPNCTKTGLSSKEFCAALFERAHVLVAPGNAFGSTGEGHFRIACTVGTDILKEAFDRMEKLAF